MSDVPKETRFVYVDRVSTTWVMKSSDPLSEGMQGVDD